MFDAVLRTGFFKGQRDTNAAMLRAAGAAQVYELSIDEAAPANLFAELCAHPGKHVLFIDNAVRINPVALKKLIRLAQTRGAGDVLGIATPVSRKLMGLFGAPTATGSVGASVVGAMYLAPWCALVPKDLLAKVDLEAAHGSITAALMAIQDHADTILAAGAEPDEIDLRTWLVDIFTYEHDSLPAGLQSLNLLPESLQPQFRLSTRGRFIEVDETPVADTSMKFSIICPAFKPKFLEDMVRSVLTQTYDNLEFLITVDGPPEREEIAIRETLAKFSHDPRLKVNYQENCGTGLTRASLAEAAVGEYIISIDDDDMFVPHTVERFARAIELAGDHAPAALRGGTELFGFADRYLPPRTHLLVDGIPCDYFEANQPWCLHTATLRANGGLVGDPALRHCGEDADYFLRLDLQPKQEVLLIDEPLYLRRLSAVNQTLTFTNEEFHSHLDALGNNYVHAGYTYNAHHFEDERPFIRQTTRYVERKSGRELFTGTRYFNYSLSGKAHEAIIDLELTALCNADCTFCPRENLGRTNKYLPMETVHEIARQVAHDGIHRKIVLCGIGEPTLHPEVENIVRILTEAGAEVCMTNNGSRMDTERFERLIKAGLKEVNFSVNAATEETRQLVMKQKFFDKVCDNVRNALELRDTKYPHLEVHISFVLCPQNQHEVDEFVKTWRGTTANALWIHPVNNRANLLTSEYGEYDPMGVAQRYSRDPRVIVDLWDHGFATDSTKTCTIAQATQFIDADGDVLLCALDHERKNIIGNVADRPLVYMQMQKLDDYRHGRFDTFCNGCTYCPKTHKSVAVFG